MRTKTNLTAWQWRLASSNGNATADSLPTLRTWRDVQTFPSVVHMELAAQGLIPDLRVGENERQVQWVGEADWEYRGEFVTPERTGAAADLVFEGLDTFATVTLNGQLLLESDNMFLAQRVSVREALRPPGQANDLHVRFASAARVGTQLEREHGARPAVGVSMRDRRRHLMRKAQCHWGWDWGPIVLTAGPYRPVYLDVYAARIDDVFAVSALAEDHAAATVDVSVSVVACGSESLDGLTAAVRLTGPQGEEVAQAQVPIPADVRRATTTLAVPSPQLWWPNGQGAQPLYTLTVELPGHDAQTTRVGLRTIEVVQRPLQDDDEPGTTFLFRVNGRDIFAQGGNWIPADCLLPTVSRARYYRWMQSARDCHMNLVRVWGGGIYETDDFLDACDELGLLVWHDFAFACNNLPLHASFVAAVAREAEAQTVRLRSRASLALLCGGNEDFLLWDMEQSTADHAEELPQRHIYLDLLPAVVARLAPHVFYWPNSPWSRGGRAANDATTGDVHQWSVWHLEQRPYQDYKHLSGRFVSEFGMHGFPVQRTLDFVLRGAAAAERHAQSRLVDAHNKGHGAHTRIARYLAENVRYDTASLANFAYASQLVQAEALGYALRDWKRLFAGPGRERCAGAVVWQLNDVYPGTSWSLVDYFVRPKPAWYAARRALAPVSVAAERSPRSRWVDEDRPLADALRPPSFALFAHNTAPQPARLRLGLRAFDFATGQWTALESGLSRPPLTLLPGQNTELGPLAAQPSWTADSLVVLEVTLSDDAGNVVARFVDWPEPYRYLSWPPDTALSVVVQRGGAGSGPWEDHVTVSANQPLKGVWLEPVYDGSEPDDGPEPLWEDNMMDLLPDSPITVGVSGLQGRQVRARFLADWEVGRGGTL